MYTVAQTAKIAQTLRARRLSSTTTRSYSRTNRQCVCAVSRWRGAWIYKNETRDDDEGDAFNEMNIA